MNKKIKAILSIVLVIVVLVISILVFAFSDKKLSYEVKRVSAEEVFDDKYITYDEKFSYLGGYGIDNITTDEIIKNPDYYIKIKSEGILTHNSILTLNNLEIDTLNIKG